MCGDLCCFFKCLYFQIIDYYFREYIIINKLVIIVGKVGYFMFFFLQNMYIIYESVSVLLDYQVVFVFRYI